MTDAITSKKNRNVVIYSLLAVVFMGLFMYFGLRPMYYLICEWTGITGSQFEASAAKPVAVNQQRQVRVQFLAINNANMPWQFRPEQSQLTVKVGEVTRVNYVARNGTLEDMVAQAVPSLSPFEATNYFIKTACFCFDQQPLAAGETVQMGLVFQVDPELPKWVKTISLTYTLFDITDAKRASSDALSMLVAAYD